MATGNYGLVRDADVSVNDMEIFYVYSPDRATKVTEVKSLNPTQVIEKLDNPNNTGEILGGLYTLILPTTIFNRVGFYDIIIRPKRIKVRITDCGVLSSKPDIKGIIFNLNDISSDDVFRFENGNLVGYRVEYLNPNTNVAEKKIQNLFRIVTSNNKVEPVSENLTNTTQKAVRYRLNDNSSLVFCTLTPSSAPSVKPNAIPFIGQPNQEVYVIPTFFDPMFVSIQIAEHDIETLAIGLFGNQSKGVLDGVRTYYNENGEIYKQFDEYTIQTETGEEKLYEVKEERTNIDFTKDLNIIKNS